ncbi:MAG: hypothetical protein ACR2K9_02565 [Solirubrobacteraceae bacterium]
MPRQRLRLNASPAVAAERLLVVLLALLPLWYGLMLILLAVKVSPGTVNDLSGYRTLYDDLSSIKPADITGIGRAIAAGAGLLAFLVLGYFALKALPHPSLARADLPLGDGERGDLVVEPRALERLAESAAAGHPAVAGATGRFGDDQLEVLVTVKRPRELAETLRSVQQRVRIALEAHELPAMPVNVTLSGLDRTTRRDLR